MERTQLLACGRRVKAEQGRYGGCADDEVPLMHVADERFARWAVGLRGVGGGGRAECVREVGSGGRRQQMPASS